MGVVLSIATVKENLEDQGNMYILLSYAQSHTVCTYHMLNLCTKNMVLSCAVIWLNKNCGEYISRK